MSCALATTSLKMSLQASHRTKRIHSWVRTFLRSYPRGRWTTPSIRLFSAVPHRPRRRHLKVHRPSRKREPPSATISPPAAPEAQLTMAEIIKRANAARYGFDRNVPQDYAQAMQLFRKAADQGNAEAQNAIGEMYLKGQGVPQATR